MILTPHFLVGAAVVTHIQPLGLAAFLAFLSHYLLDAIPHWDYPTLAVRQKRWKQAFPVFLKVALDFSLGMILVFLLAKNLFLAFTGAFFAILPDVITFFTIILPKNGILHAHHFFHDRICHWFGRKRIHEFWKLFSQLLVLAAAIYLLA